MILVPSLPSIHKTCAVEAALSEAQRSSTSFTLRLLHARAVSQTLRLSFFEGPQLKHTSCQICKLSASPICV